MIIKETTADGRETFRGNVVINEGKAWSIGKTEEELGNHLDDICSLKLDYKLHDNPGKSVILEYPRHFTIPFSYEFNRVFLN